jgi:hypothetical protein
MMKRSFIIYRFFIGFLRMLVSASVSSSSITDVQPLILFCVQFLSEDAEVISKKVRSSVLQLKNDKNAKYMSGSLTTVLDVIDKLDCINCLSRNVRSVCSLCSPSFPKSDEEEQNWKYVLQDRPLWLRETVCDTIFYPKEDNNDKLVANTYNSQEVDDDDDILNFLKIIIEFLIGLLTSTPTLFMSPTVSPSTTLSPSPSPSTAEPSAPIETKKPTNSPNIYVSCQDGLMQSDTDNNQYIDENEYLYFVGALGCDNPTKLTAGLWQAFATTCVAISLDHSYTSFYIAPAVEDFSFNGYAQLQIICGLAVGAIYSGYCPVPGPVFVPTATTQPSTIPPVTIPTQPQPIPVSTQPQPIPISEPTTSPTLIVTSAVPVAEPVELVPFRSPTIPPILKSCSSNLRTSDADGDMLLTEKEYLEFIKLSSDCYSLLLLPQQQTEYLMLWCKEDNSQLCKSFPAFKIIGAYLAPLGDDLDRLNSVCDLIDVNCATLTEVPVPTVDTTESPVFSPQSANPISQHVTIPSSEIPSFSPTITPSRRIRSDSLPSTSPTLPVEYCIDALANADVDNNSFLDSNEFLRFMVDYFQCPDLAILSPLQQDTFIELSCECKNVVGASLYCCLPRNARIAIAGAHTTNASTLEKDALQYVCTKSQYVRDQGCLGSSSFTPVQVPGEFSPAVVSIAPDGSFTSPISNTLPSVNQVILDECLTNLSQSDSNDDGVIDETEYGQFLNSYGKCGILSLSDQQKDKFLSLSRSVSSFPYTNFSISSINVAEPTRTIKESEFLSNVCALEGLCSTTIVPSVTGPISNECTSNLTKADVDRNELLDETEFGSFVSEYLVCPITNGSALITFDLLLDQTMPEQTRINISGASLMENTRSTSQNETLNSICFLTKQIQCQDDKDMCSTNLVFADKNKDGYLFENEYLEFLKLQLKDCEQITYLSLAHRTIFQFLSCLCVGDSSDNWDCCHPSHAKIDIKGASLPKSLRSESSTISNICTSTDNALGCSVTSNTSEQAAIKEERLELVSPIMLVTSMVVIAIICIRVNHTNAVS